MAVTTFETTSFQSGSYVSASVTVSGITGNVTNVRLEADIVTGDASYTLCEVYDDNFNYYLVWDEYDLSGSGPITAGKDVVVSGSVNQSYDFSVQDNYGSGVTLAKVRVIVTDDSGGGGGGDGGGSASNEFHFDLGTSSSPVASGYDRATGATYTSGNGFGWNQTVSNLDRFSGSDLLRDFVYNNSSTRSFLVDVPSGAYDVTITSYDASFSHGPTNWYIDGQLVGQTAANGTSGTPVTITATIASTSGQIAINPQRDASASDPNWVINAVDIVPAAPPGGILVNDADVDCQLSQFSIGNELAVDDPIGWWVPSETQDYTDNSGNNRDASVNGNVPVVTESGSGGTHAYSFGGQGNDYLIPAGTLQHGSGQDFSVALWVKFKTAVGFNDSGYIIANFGPSGYRGWAFEIYEDFNDFTMKLASTFNYGAAQTKIDATPPSPLVWTSLIMTGDRSGNLEFFVDGVSQGAASIAGGSLVNVGSSIGINTDPLDSYYDSSSDCYLDDIRVFDRKLNSLEVYNLSRRRVPQKLFIPVVSADVRVQSYPSSVLPTLPTGSLEVKAEIDAFSIPLPVSGVEVRSSFSRVNFIKGNGLGTELAWWCPSGSIDGFGTITIDDMAGNLDAQIATGVPHWDVDTGSGGSDAIHLNLLTRNNQEVILLEAPANLISTDAQWSYTVWVKLPLVLNSYLMGQLSPYESIEVVTDGRIVYHRQYSGGNDLDVQTSSGVLVANEWHCIAIVRNGSNTGDDVRIYVDGVDVTSTRVNGTGSVVPHDGTGVGWFFGGDPLYYTAGTGLFEGYFDDMRFFDSELSLEQIEHLATQRAALGPAPGTDLLVNGVDVQSQTSSFHLPSFLLPSSDVSVQADSTNVTVLWQLAVDGVNVRTETEKPTLSFTLEVGSLDVKSNPDSVYLFLLGFIPPPAAVNVRSQPDIAILEIPILVNSLESKCNPDNLGTIGEVQTIYLNSFDSRTNLDEANLSFSLNTIADARVRVQIDSVSVFDPVNTGQLFTDTMFSDAIPDSDF